MGCATFFFCSIGSPARAVLLPSLLSFERLRVTKGPKKSSLIMLSASSSSSPPCLGSRRKWWKERESVTVNPLL